MEFWRAIYPKLRDTLLGVYHYINNVRTNVRQGLRQAYSPPNGNIAFSPTLRFALPPFEGITSSLRSAFPPLKGGRGDVPLCSDTVYPA